jgi:UDP-N-acetylmuramate dehydrogenase
VRIETEVELATRSTLGVGGSARYYAQATSVADLQAALDWAHAGGHALRVLGGGSNIVIADAGFSGLVLDNALSGVRTSPRGNEVEVSVAAGENWDAFVAEMVRQGFQGLECLSGIPGRVGATPIQNVGAYGQDVSESIVRVVALDRSYRNQVMFSNAECRFAYRDSYFKSEEPERFVVSEVVFRLRPNAAPKIAYAELERELRARGHVKPSLADVRETVLALRRSKSMLIDANDPNTRSCGSFFTNPVLTPDDFTKFSFRADGEGEVPRFPQSDGRIKLAAGWLIEHAGFSRGMNDGRVGLSEKHALALVARSDAKARDVVAFARRIRTTVFERFGVELVPEPVFWGFPRMDRGLPAPAPVAVN